MASRGTFKTDTERLRRWLDKRRASLEDARRPYETLWKDVRSYYEPGIGRALSDEDNPNERDAKREDEKIINSEPRILLQRMGAGLQSGITNQARQWFRFRARDIRASESGAVRKWLDQLTERCHNAMTRSNVYSALDQIYVQLVFGQAAALVYRSGDAGIHVHVVDCGAYWLATNAQGRVDVLLRRESMTLNQAKEDFGERFLPEKLLERIERGNGEEWLPVYNLVCPVSHCEWVDDIGPDREFASIYWCDDRSNNNNGILAVRSFGYNPIIAPRWSLTSSAYGLGVGQIGLGDAKELQEIEAQKMRLIELEVRPAMAAPASMKGSPVRSGPGSITYYDDVAGTGRNPVSRLFETRQSIEAIILAQQSIEERLRRIFFSDLFSMMVNLNLAPKQMTATEVMELSAEKVALLGPVLTRLNTDLLAPLVEAVFSDVMDEAVEIGEDADELLNPPMELQGEELQVEYVSTLHAAQQGTTRINGILQLVGVVGQIAQLKPSVLDGFDEDAALGVVSRSLVEEGIVLDKREIEKIRAARAQVQAAQAQAELDAQTAQAERSHAGAMRDLAEAKTGNASVLDMIAGGGAGGGAEGGVV